MKKLIELNSEIENLSKQIINYHITHQSYLYNNKWINEIGIEYFDIWEERVKKMIDSNIDLDDTKSIQFLRIIYQEVQEIYQNKLLENYEDLDYFSKYASLKYVVNNDVNSPPKLKCSALNFPEETEFFELEIFLNRMKSIYKIDEFDFYDVDTSPFSKQSELEDLIAHKHEFNDEEIEISYLVVYLSSAFSLHREMIGNISKYIENLIKVLNKFMTFEENKDNKPSVEHVNPHNIKLELAMKKQDIAIFFHTLHELNIIRTDTNNIYDSQTKLKNFIDYSNFYYSFNNTLTKVGNIKKQFTELNQGSIKDKEVKFLKNLILKFNSRIDLLEQNKERGLP